MTVIEGCNNQMHFTLR